MGTYVQEGLSEGETVRYAAKLSLYRYWLNFLIGGFFLIVSLSVLFKWFLLPSIAHVAGAMMGLGLSMGIVALLALGVFLWPFLARRRTELVITDKRLIAKFGLLSTQSIEIRLGKIESVRVIQGLIGRMLNYGDIVVTGTGSTFDPIRHIANPLAFRTALNQAMDPGTPSETARGTASAKPALSGA